MSLRSILHTVPLTLLALIGPLAIAQPAATYLPSPAPAGSDRAATGVFALGEARFRRESVTLLALVQNGTVMQVQARHRGAWLAKRRGSVGGKTLAPSKFDELASIAGGIGKDVRHRSAKVREDFARAAGLAVFPSPATARGSMGLLWLAPIAAARAGDCGAIGCARLFHGAADRVQDYDIRLSDDGALWGFEGYGIVAIWAVPGD